MGRNNKRFTNNKKRFSKGETWAIVVDGETEDWYFRLLKEHEKEKLLNKRINISPKLAIKKPLKQQYEDVKNKVNSGFDKVIWLLDFDTVLEEERKRKKGGTSILQTFEKYKEDLEKLGVKVFVNTPCLEFWILLHFEQNGKFYSLCKNSINELKKKYLNDYEKSKKYYMNNDIYKKIKPYQATAKTNAAALGNYNFENPRTAKAEIFEILDLLFEDE